MAKTTLSKDGKIFHVYANMAVHSDIRHLFAYSFNGTGQNSGCGLYRTDPSLLDALKRGIVPTMKTFADWYMPIAKKMHVMDNQGNPEEDKPLPIEARFFDFGGDKLPEGSDEFRITPSLDPFLGLRGVRLYQNNQRWEQMFINQLGGFLMASHFNPLFSAMLPMVSTLEEVLWSKERLEKVKANFRSDGDPFNENFRFGAMIETPVAMMIADDLAKEVDFFSIGTNDLIQYVMAASRSDSAVKHLHDPFHPAVIASLTMIKRAQSNVKNTMQKELEVGICGNAASDPLFVLILMGEGIDKISVASPSEKPKVEYLISQLDSTICRTIVDEYVKTYNQLQGSDSREKIQEFDQAKTGHGDIGHNRSA